MALIHIQDLTGSYDVAQLCRPQSTENRSINSGSVIPLAVDPEDDPTNRRTQAHLLFVRSQQQREKWSRTSA